MASCPSVVETPAGFLDLGRDTQVVHERHDPIAAFELVGPERRQVARLRQRPAQRDVSLVLAVPVVEDLAADDAVLVIQQRGRRDQSCFERRAIRVDLERRADPTPTDRIDAGQVDLAADRGVVVVGAPDHRQDLAVVRVHHQHRPGIHAYRGVRLHPRLYPFGRHHLRVHVQRRRDPQAALVQRLVAVLLRDVALDVVDEVRGQGVVRRGQPLVRRDHLVDQVAVEQLDRRRKVDVAHCDHPVENLAPALLGGIDLIGRAEHVVVGWRLGQAGEKAGLCPRQIAGVHLKVGLRRRLRSIGAVAVVDRVEVQVQDLRLGVPALHLLRQHQFAELEADRPVLRLNRVQDVVLHHLLGDGRAPKGRRTVSEVVPDRDRQPAVVDARVGIEGAVLGVDGRPLERLADLAQRHDRPVLVIQRLDQVPVPVQNAAGLAERAGLQGVDRRQVAGEVVDDPNRPARPQQPEGGHRHEHGQDDPSQPRMASLPAGWPAVAARTRLSLGGRRRCQATGGSAAASSRHGLGGTSRTFSRT